MRAYFGPNIAEVFEMILEDLWEDSDFVTSPRGMEVKEIIDCSMEIENPMLNIYTNKYRSSPLKYIAAELLCYFSGTKNPTYIEKHASLWKSLHNPDGTVNSLYGNLLFVEKNEHGLTQYQWVIESLKKDKDSRQAFMHFNKPYHQWFGNKDQVCTLQAIFHIRENKLYMTIFMRSGDIIYGFMTDYAFFTILMQHVYLELKETYSKLKIGSYTHITSSMHLYERHYDLVKKMVKTPYFKREPFKPGSLPLLNTKILDNVGNILPKYKKIFNQIIQQEPNYNIKKTDNDLLNWCINTLK